MSARDGDEKPPGVPYLGRNLTEGLERVADGGACAEIRVTRRPDRVSVSFWSGPDPDVIITVTFDIRVVIGIDDESIIKKARAVLTTQP